jgi:uncharacterized membrane protein
VNIGGWVVVIVVVVIDIVVVVVVVVVMVHGQNTFPDRECRDRDQTDTIKSMDSRS